jgi:RNA polymerase sigma-70 factor (ECF subfamily)
MTDTHPGLPGRLARDLDRAFPELVAEMQGLVFNGARRWLPVRQDAEDVTQEVFVRAYQALQAYPAERIREVRLRPWLSTITLNLCRNHARTRSRRPQQVAWDDQESVAADTVAPAAVAAVAVDEWRRRLAMLPARQRDAIILRHVIGLTYDEIGEVLQRPTGTVKSDVNRGLHRLRAMIDPEELS